MSLKLNDIEQIIFIRSVENMTNFFTELSKLPTDVITALSVLSGAIGGLLASILTIFIGKIILGARDIQDKESEWRNHAIELTKLDVERLLKSGRDFTKEPLRPCILEFLANYRDLQELNIKSAKELYEIIESKRIKKTMST
jgi:hypothetical protein